jgi:hypothetical protein
MINETHRTRFPMTKDTKILVDTMRNGTNENGRLSKRFRATDRPTWSTSAPNCELAYLSLGTNAFLTPDPCRLCRTPHSFHHSLHRRKCLVVASISAVISAGCWRGTSPSIVAVDGPVAVVVGACFSLWPGDGPVMGPMLYGA